LAPTDTAGRAVAWAVVGLGGYARERMLPALRRARGTRLAGVYTRSELVRTGVAAEYGVRGYGSLQAILEDPAFDLVYLATPHDLHAAQTVACAVAGKHVLVEKPMAVSEAEAGAMVDACTRAGVTLRVGFQFRYHPAHRQAQALLASGEIGDLVWAAARWSAYRPADTGWRLDLGRAGGTLLTARGVHLIDLIRFVTDTECVAVSGMSDGLRPESPADDVTVGLLALTSGAFAHVLCTRLVAGGGRWDRALRDAGDDRLPLHLRRRARGNTRDAERGCRTKAELRSLRPAGRAGRVRQRRGSRGARAAPSGHRGRRGARRGRHHHAGRLGPDRAHRHAGSRRPWVTEGRGPIDLL
jgi:predicted dehydrogenase